LKVFIAQHYKTQRLKTSFIGNTAEVSRVTHNALCIKHSYILGNKLPVTSYNPD